MVEDASPPTTRATLVKQIGQPRRSCLILHVRRFLLVKTVYLDIPSGQSSSQEGRHLSLRKHFRLQRICTLAAPRATGAISFGAEVPQLVSK
jgi:hypothetical protein